MVMMLTGVALIRFESMNGEEEEEDGGELEEDVADLYSKSDEGVATDIDTNKSSNETKTKPYLLFRLLGLD